MALISQNQIAVLATVAEALKLGWALFLPYVVLALVFSLPLVGAGGLGLFDSLDEFARQAQDSATVESLGQFPLGEILLALGLGFIAISGCLIAALYSRSLNRLPSDSPRRLIGVWPSS